MLAAAEAVKKAEPGVTPINIYSGVGTGEATSMQGFEMFLYGTNNPLYNTTSNKWEMAGTGFQSVLNVYKQPIPRTLRSARRPH